MAVAYPSIDAGFIVDPTKKLACILSDFMEAEYSQSYLFLGTISSLPWIIQQNQDDPNAVANAVRMQLQACTTRYFDDVQIECNAVTSVSATSYDLQLYVRARQGTEEITAYKLLKIQENKFKESVDIRK